MGSSIDTPIDTIASEITRTKHKNPERTSISGLNLILIEPVLL